MAQDLDYKILGGGMVGDYRGGGLLRIKQKPGCKSNPDILFRMQQRK